MKIVLDYVIRCSGELDGLRDLLLYNCDEVDIYVLGRENNLCTITEIANTFMNDFSITIDEYGVDYIRYKCVREVR